MSPPKATSPTKKKTKKTKIGQNVLPTKNLVSLKKEEESIKNNEESSKTIPLPQLTPNNNECQGKIEKTTETIKIVPVSNIEIQPVQHTPKVQSSTNTPRPQVKNLPKLQMTSKDKASNTKTTKSQAKEQSATHQQIQSLPSLSFSNETPNSSNILAVSSNVTSTLAVEFGAETANPPAKASSPTKKNTKKAPKIGQKVLLVPNPQSQNKKEEIVKSNEQSLKTTALLQLTPNNNDYQVKIEKTTETIKIVPVSNIEIQPVLHTPKVQSSTSAPRPQVKNLPKLQMTSKEEASSTKSTKLQAKEQSPTTQQIQNLSSSSLSNESPNSSNVLAVSTLNETSSNVKSETKTILSRNPLKNSRKKINKQDPKTLAAKQNKPSIKEEHKQVSKEKKSNKSLQFASNDDIVERQRDEKKQSTKKLRRNDIDPEDAPKIENTYIADGLREDCARLVDKCLQVYKLNFEKFCEIWKQMGFPCVFHERQSSVEIAELSEEAIHVAKVHMVAKNVNFEENVAGLFLVYAFLNHQPYKEFAALRLVPADVPSIKRLEAEAKKQRRHDVLYILGSVLIKGPCQFHVLSREVALEMPIRKYFDGSIQASWPNVESVLSKTAECVQYFKDLIVMDQRYSAIRQQLRDRHGGVDKIRRLCTLPAASLFELYRTHVPGGMTCERHIENLLEGTKSKAPVQEEDRHSVVKSIKDRAMANTVDPMRHLTGVGERHDKSFSPDLGESEIESKPPARHKAQFKGKGKGKGKKKGKRSSARTLQELFGSTEDETPYSEVPLKTYQKEMPVLDMTEDLITVTDLEMLSPEKKLPSMFSGDNDKRGSPVGLDDTKSESELTTANDHAYRKAKAQDSNVNKPDNKLMSDQDSEKIDISPLCIFVHEKPIIETKLEKQNESQKQVFKMNENTNCRNSNDLHFHERHINIELDSMPVEIHTANDNIEIEIIDNFKDGAGTKNDSNDKGSDKPKDPDSVTTQSESKVFQFGNLSTDNINARFLRRKRKELNRMKKKPNHSQETNQSKESSSKKDTKSEPTFEVDESDASFPSAEEIEVRFKTKKKGGQKRVRLKSKLKKMGILEVANLNSSGDDD